MLNNTMTGADALDLTTPDGIADALAAGHDPDDLERERRGCMRELALAWSEERRRADQLEQERDTALSRASTASLALTNAFERAARDADRLASALGHDDLIATGPTPANEKFVSAMAAMDEDEIAEAIELAEREERERYYQDTNETLGLSVGGVW